MECYRRAYQLLTFKYRLNLPRVWTVGHLVAVLCPSSTFIGLSSAVNTGMLRPENGCRKTWKPLFCSKHLPVCWCIRYKKTHKTNMLLWLWLRGFLLPVFRRCRVFCLASLGSLSQQTPLTWICPARAANGPLKKLTHFTAGLVPGNNNNNNAKWHRYLPLSTYWLLQRWCSNYNELHCVWEQKLRRRSERFHSPLLPCRLKPVRIQRSQPPLALSLWVRKGVSPKLLNTYFIRVAYFVFHKHLLLL